MVEISHDAFARQSIVRRITENHSECDNCGQQRLVLKVVKGLYQYGTSRDDRPGESNVNWHKGLFCSKGCHDAYHS
jgi:hypothetical protein